MFSGADLRLAATILRNDLRVFLRSLQRRKMGAATSVLMQVFFLAMLHGIALSAMMPLRERGGPEGLPEFGAALILLLVTVVSLNRSLEVLYNRGDLPMLLASPASSRVVVASRLVAVVMEALIASAPLALALIDMSVVLFGPKWAWAWFAWLGGIVAVSPLAMMVTLVIVRLFGARRARTALQVVAVVIGMALFMGFQMMNTLVRGRSALIDSETGASIIAWFDRAPFNQILEAASGNVEWTGLFLVIGLATAVPAYRRVAREFTGGAQAASADVAAERRTINHTALARTWSSAFRTAPWLVVIAKDLRLVLRNPLLLLRGFSQIVYLVPALIGVLWQHQLAGLVAFGPIAAAMITSTLAALTTIDDEATELTGASPTECVRLRMWRTMAMGSFGLVIGIALAVLVAARGAWLAAAMSLAATLFCVAGPGWFAACHTRPRTPEERARNAPPSLATPVLLAMLLGGLNAAGPITLVTTEAPLAALIIAGVALGLTSLTFLARPKRNSEV